MPCCLSILDHHPSVPCPSVATWSGSSRSCRCHWYHLVTVQETTLTLLLARGSADHPKMSSCLHSAAHYLLDAATNCFAIALVPFSGRKPPWCSTLLVESREPVLLPVVSTMPRLEEVVNVSFLQDLGHPPSSSRMKSDLYLKRNYPPSPGQPSGLDSRCSQACHALQAGMSHDSLS